MEPYSSDDIKRKKRKYEEREISLEERIERIFNRIENTINERFDSFDKRAQTRDSRKKIKSMYDASFKIIVFGDVDCGKETLMQKFLTNLFVSDQTMTIGVDFYVKSLSVDEQKVKLQVWNFGGEGRFKFLLPTYTRQARGGLFLYDITNYSSIAHIDDWLNLIRKEIKAEDMFPIIVVGNKADLVEEREVSSAEGIRIAKSRNVNGFIEISAKTGENVEKTFKALTGLMLNAAGDRISPEIVPIIPLASLNPTDKKNRKIKMREQRRNIEISSVALPPSKSPPIKKKRPKNPRGTIMKELRDLFKGRRQK
ncbi:unnamed protein product [marine sediment metagenome]|uniref:GTP-binding protein n=1 Tax=marine sediment metagenome TaxID=412755 RepID=X1FFU4_9ZZZZ